MSHYTKEQLKNRINAGIKGKIGVLIDVDETLNQVVRQVVSDIDLRSMRRMTTIQGGIFSNILCYPAPADLKMKKIVSLSKQAQAGDTYWGFNLVPYEQFNQRLGYVNRSYNDDSDVQFGTQREPYTFTFDDKDEVHRLLISAPLAGHSTTLSSLDSLTADGTWMAFDDAANLTADAGNFLYGTASLRFDVTALGQTRSGIMNTTMTPFDLSDNVGANCSVFVAAYISDESEITNYTLRIGNDISNYYEMVVTSTHANTGFEAGWNILRFDLYSKATIGTVDPTNLSYISVFLTKTLAKAAAIGFHFDHIVHSHGDIYELRYYSHFGWQTVDGIWIENSTADDDRINANSDEFELFVDKGVQIAGEEVDEMGASQSAAVRYERRKSDYLRHNPSEALIETSDYMAQYFI